MMEDRDESAIGPLPQGWLPHPQASDGDAIWEARVERIMAAAAELRSPNELPSVEAPTPWQLIALWWRPAAMVAIAATVLFLLVGGRGTRTGIPPRAIPLNVVASYGDPVTLWEAFGVQAHPVLALIALQESDAEPTRTVAPTSPEGKRP